MPPGPAVVKSHLTADGVENPVRPALPNCDLVDHREPHGENLQLRERVLAIALAEPLVRVAQVSTISEHSGHLSVSLQLKMPADLAIADAHDATKRVEAALARERDVEEVQTQLEPLELPATELLVFGAAGGVSVGVPSKPEP